jgi:hypothetical protein
MAIACAACNTARPMFHTRRLARRSGVTPVAITGPSSTVSGRRGLNPLSMILVGMASIPSHGRERGASRVSILHHL